MNGIRKKFLFDRKMMIKGIDTYICSCYDGIKRGAFVMKIYKGYVFRIYPSDEQKILIHQTIGCNRFVYNYFLEEKKKEYQETKRTKSAYDQIKLLPSLSNTYPFLKEVDSCSLRNTLFFLENAYQRFFHGSGYPKFKRKGVLESYKTNNTKNAYHGKTYESIKVDFQRRIITLPKLKEMPFRGYRHQTEFHGDIKSAVIRKDATKYYVSILVEEEVPISPFVPKTIVGLDLGIKDLIVTSNNEKIKNTIQINHKRLIGLQRGLSRCQKGSKNHYKMKLKIRRLYQKIINARKYLLHDITNKLINENDMIVTEHLDVKSMQKNHGIAKRLAENPLSEIIRILTYKAKWKNKRLIQIDRYYPSSQTCSVCNYQNKNIKNLSIRTWECPMCHTMHEV